MGMGMGESRINYMSVNVANVVKRNRATMRAVTSNFYNMMRNIKQSVEAQHKYADQYVESSKEHQKAYAELCKVVSNKTDEGKEKNEKMKEVLEAGGGR